MISAKIVADSKNTFGNRITTMVVTFPRYILAELNTHRMFSRNSASSRAIPFEKMLKSVQENPFIPIAWMKDHRGMQGSEFFTDEMIEFPPLSEPILVGDALRRHWLGARDKVIDAVKTIAEIGLTKQICNRPLEAFMNHTVIITATEWENFFALRCPKYVTGYKLGSPEEKNKKFHRSWKDLLKEIPSATQSTVLEKLQVNQGQADIHMMALAEAMCDAYSESQPKDLRQGQWHIPFGDNIDIAQLREQVIGSKDNYDFDEVVDAEIKIAVARCARVSYTVVGEEDKPADYLADVKLHDRLLESKHASPFEHVAQASISQERSRNFTGGWIQYRSLVDGD